LQLRYRRHLEASMTTHATILCPVDFSEASAGALRSAAAIAAHLGTRLVVLTVEDPLLTEAVDLGTGTVWSPDDCRAELARFADESVGPQSEGRAGFDYEVAVGKPAAEILRVSRERECGLVVISTHGLTGLRKLFFGSTTERVLRETAVPVLVTPAADPGIVHLADAKQRIGRILVPVDLSGASQHHAQQACALGDVLDVPLLLVHVIEPLRSRHAVRHQLASLEADRRAVAEDGLAELVATLPPRRHPEALVAFGETAEELVKVARDRHAGLIVMGLHGSPPLGPRMGSVTYRLLCLSQAMVLALPPAPAGNAGC
jgi:nucleotide-binding universal stress UspA family protein